ncbi:MAG: nucleotidyltransferase domain-containing protein, partial [Thermoplasmata archaeon]
MNINFYEGRNRQARTIKSSDVSPTAYDYSLVLSEALSEISPSAEEEAYIRATVERIVEKCREQIAQRKIDAELLVAGSIAKGTYSKNPDLDLFIMFPEGTPQEFFEPVVLEIGKSVLHTFDTRYAQHPYAHGTFEKLEVDIVPCTKVKKPASGMSPVDRTPFHIEFIKSAFSKSGIPHAENEVRLLKAFMKSNYVYGAEIAVEGFSGYLAELLVIYFGSFINVLKFFSHFKPSENALVLTPLSDLKEGKRLEASTIR